MIGKNILEEKSVQVLKMAKKVYAETVKSWLINNKIWVGGSGTLIGAIFLYLVMTGAISNYTYSGDMICAGTIKDPCYAYINFTANEDIFIYPIDYDPYGRNAPFEFDPNVKSWKLQRSWGTGWRDIPLNQSCTGTWCGLSDSKDERIFSIAFRKGKDYQIRLVAYKNNPYETIKWGAFKVIDPDWIGLTDITKITKDDVFKELVLNDEKKAEAILTIKNPMETTDIKRENIKVNFIEDCGSVAVDDKGNKKYKLLINSTCETERVKEIIYDTQRVCYNSSVIDNKTFKNITSEICNDEEYIKDTVYENYTYPCFKEFEKINSNDLRNIKIEVDDIRWNTCKDGTFGYKIDWQMEVKLDDTFTTNTLIKKEWEWWNVSYGFKREINCTNLDDLTPIVINGSNGFTINGEKQIVWTYCSGTGTALYLHNSSDYTAYVVANDTTQLPHEVEFGNGTSYNPENVYDSNFVGVWHKNDITTSSINDSTANSNDGTKGSANQPVEIDGKIGKAQNYSGGNYYINIGNTGFPIGSSARTLSAWVKGGVVGEKEHIFHYGSTNVGQAYGLGEIGHQIDDNTLWTHFWSTDARGNIVPTNQWVHVAVVSSGDSHQFYIDGVSAGSATQAFNTVIGTENRIGSRISTVAETWAGQIDEVTFSNISRNASYINQTYQNAIGTSGYGNLGAEESGKVNIPPTIIANITKPDTVYTNTDWLLNITATDPENASFTAYTQFYINGESSGGEASHSIENNSNTNVANLSSSSFSAGDTLIAEMWVSDIEYNSTKTNTSEVTVSYFLMGGTVKDSNALVINNANVIIMNQTDNTVIGTTTSNSTGGWNYSIGDIGTYLVIAYDPNNSTIDGDADPHIIVN